LKRRTFVYLAIAGAAAVVVPFAAYRRYSDSLVKTLEQPEFMASIADEKTVRDIGAAYRLRNPDETEKNKLINLLLTSSGGDAQHFTPGADESKLIEQLDLAVRDDYAHGRVLTIKGWVLSLTEARQCALYSISK
jgi:hypothetical protein